MNEIKYIQAEDRETKIDFLSILAVREEILRQHLVEQKESFTPENFIGVTITHSFDDTKLPISLDYVFLKNDCNTYVKTKVTIRGCFNYGLKFHTGLWKGYNHLAILEFEEAVPEIFLLLKPHLERRRWDAKCIICDKKDAQECQRQLKAVKEEIEDFMRTHNPELYEANRKEEIEANFPATGSTPLSQL